jgi:hypothetical protein
MVAAEPGRSQKMEELKGFEPEQQAVSRNAGRMLSGILL